MAPPSFIQRTAGTVTRTSFALFAAVLLGACSATGYSIRDLAESINATRHVGAPVLQAGDTVKVTFLTKTEWNQEVRIRPDGNATLLGLDDVQLAGLTLPQADERLSKLYASVNTDVAVERPLSLDLVGAGTESAHGSAYVIGEVRTPGAVQLSGSTFTLVDAIGAAGGHLKSTANLRNVILVRRLASGEMRSWRLDADIYQWGALPAIYLQPRDVIFVPNTAVDDANIWVDKYIRQMLPFPYIMPPV
jgi:protein involved in polysaccharide export with SLBB domain